MQGNIIIFFFNLYFMIFNDTPDIQIDNYWDHSFCSINSLPLTRKQELIAEIVMILHNIMHPLIHWLSIGCPLSVHLLLNATLINELLTIIQ